MSRLLVALLAAAFATPALAAADPHAGHGAAAPADPHAGHGAAAPSPAHVGHAAPSPGPATAVLPPTPPTDNAADAVYGAAAMERSRRILRQEHGGGRFARTMVDTFELRPGSGGDGYGWNGEFRYGGDIDRLALKTEGEGEIDGKLEQAEVQALYSRAVGPYFDLQAGVRQDLGPRPRRTYATVGVDGLAPYWFEVEASLFLSNEGELFARLEGSYDLRLTQRLIAQPRAELDIAAQDAPELGLAAGPSDLELGLRLRYELRREFAPYVGVHYARRLGGTADLARAAGERPGAARLVVGVRAWF